MAAVATADGRRVSVMGALDEAALPVLTHAIGRGNVVLDLSEVTDADESTVSLLARLPAGQCGFVGCPRWLAQRVERRLIDLASGVW
jgi:anti-anti-sigma regulatory factor